MNQVSEDDDCQQDYDKYLQVSIHVVILPLAVRQRDRQISKDLEWTKVEDSTAPFQIGLAGVLEDPVHGAGIHVGRDPLGARQVRGIAAALEQHMVGSMKDP